MENLSKVYCLIKEGQDLCVTLYDVFESNIFKGIDMTLIKTIIPLWMVDAGISAESPLDKKLFEKLVNANNNEITHKILYGFDCEILVATLQDRLSSIGDLTKHLYRNISSTSKSNDEEYEIGVRHTDAQSTVCFTFINGLFITLCSMLDIITKISIELDSINRENIDFTKYPKFKSNGKLYGQKQLVNSKLINHTIFEEPPIIRQAISIRDEIVHNGTWDYRPAIYGGYKGDEYEEWIMIPEFESTGAFVSYKNRKRFYTKGSKMNVVLIPLLIEVLGLVNKTILEINSLYVIEDKCKTYDFSSFSQEIENWTSSFETIKTNEHKA